MIKKEEEKKYSGNFSNIGAQEVFNKQTHDLWEK